MGDGGRSGCGRTDSAEWTQPRYFSARLRTGQGKQTPTNKQNRRQCGHVTGATASGVVRGDTRESVAIVPVAAVVPHNNASTIECTHRRLCIVPRPRSTSVSFLLPSPPARVVVCVRPTNSGDTPEPSPPLSSDMGHEGGKWWSKGNERRTENTNERQWGPAHASRESPSQ